MHVAHSNIGNGDKPKKVKGGREGALRWMGRQLQSAYDEAVNKRSARLKEIQKHIPGWMPKKNF